MSKLNSLFLSAEYAIGPVFIYHRDVGEHLYCTGIIILMSRRILVKLIDLEWWGSNREEKRKLI